MAWGLKMKITVVIEFDTSKDEQYKNKTFKELDAEFRKNVEDDDFGKILSITRSQKR